MSFNWKRWLLRADWDAGQKTNLIRRKPGLFRPRLEGLESRLAPANLIIDTVLDNTTADSSLSLREAVLLVDNGGDASAALGRPLTAAERPWIIGAFGSGDAILFTTALNSQTITLTSGELLLSKDVAVIGPGADLLTVSGNHATRVFEVADGVTAFIERLTIADGMSDFGGGIINSGTLTVNDSTLSGNSARIEGGGIYNQGTLNVNGCNLSGNSARDDGGGIFNQTTSSLSGTLTISDSTLSGNSADHDGGGIISFGTLTVTNSALSGNSANHDGGAILNWQGRLTISDSTLENNSANFGSGGGIYDLGSGIAVSIGGSTLRGNSATSGGGIYTQDETFNVSDCTLSNNSAPFGGAICNTGEVSIIDGILYASGNLTVTDCDLSGNSADFPGGGFGGAIENFGILTVTGSTLTDNAAGTDGGGIHNQLGTVAVSNIVLNGNNAGDGGGIYNQAGALTVSSCTLSGNSADTTTVLGSGNGGGIYNLGTATVSGSILRDNSAQILGGGISNTGTLIVSGSMLDGNTSVNFGGGIANGGTLNVTDSTLISNAAGFGGGIWNSFGTATIADCTLLSNSGMNGGGIFNQFGTAQVIESTLAVNTASSTGGGVYDDSGTLTVGRCTLAGNSSVAIGGGIFDIGGKLTVNDSTIARNSAAYGGGISTFGRTLNLINSTLTGNSASSDGGGIFNAATNMTVTSSTVSGNSSGSNGGGIISFQTLTARNNIVAGNTSPNSPDLDGAITINQGHNLIGNTSGGSGFAASDLLNVNPLLASLGDYGGPTQTMPLLPGSPAIDAGDNTNAPATDQRGFARTVNGAIDIGAFESRGFTLAIAGGNNQQTLVNSSFPAPLSVTVTSTFGEPVLGGVVTFSAPGSGASTTFPVGNTATLNAAGQGSVSANANGIADSYSVTATARGASSVTFNLKNVDATTVVLTSSANPSNLGQAVTFTAVVTTNTPGSGTPTGTVTFFDGVTALATMTLDATGHASFTTAGFALAAGSHNLTASYSGDPNFLVSTSAILTQTVRSVQDQGTALNDKIDALVSSGALSTNNGNTLKSLVTDAMNKFSTGNTNAGINKMNAFINKVNDFKNSGRLTAAQAQDLINAAQAILTAAQGP